MTASQYRLTIVGPGDEVLDEVRLDGYNLDNVMERIAIGDQISDGMGSVHREACAALPGALD